jgi:hypothetical protein
VEELLPQMNVAPYAIDVFALWNKLILDALGKRGEYV